MAGAMLPAVLLGTDTPIGLAIIRDLGRRGVPVVGIGRERSGVGMSSRYLQRGLLRAAGEEALIAQLLALREETGEACLFAISESDIALLNRHRARLTGYRLMFADAQRMERVLNKDQTYAAAARVGLHVPRTEQVTSFEQAGQLAPQLRYPVVLKWANPNDVVRTLEQAGLALDKTHYCYTAEALLAYLTPYQAAGVYPLIQEYCTGYGLGQFVLMQDGQALSVFQHRRVHEWPPEGGFSSLCESVGLEQHAALMAQSVALLRALEWEGVAMVEYRYDPLTGAASLMEINGRFWGSLPLAYHAGAAFPWLLYQLHGMQVQVGQQTYRSRLRCRFMIPEAKRLWRVLFQRGRIADRAVVFPRWPALAGFLWDFIRPNTCYYVFHWRDPAPFFRDLIQAARRI